MLPTFETERLLVRPRTVADLEDCLAMDRDPAVTRYVPGPWDDSERHRAFVLDRMRTVYPDGLGYWSVVEGRGAGAFLGWILLLPYDAVKDEVEIGWRFVRAAWGHGYATEAAAPVLDHAFRTAGLDTIVADIDPANTASIRVAEKIGLAWVADREIGGARVKSYQVRRPG